MRKKRPSKTKHDLWDKVTQGFSVSTKNCTYGSYDSKGSSYVLARQRQAWLGKQELTRREVGRNNEKLAGRIGRVQ